MILEMISKDLKAILDIVNFTMGKITERKLGKIV